MWLRFDGTEGVARDCDGTVDSGITGGPTAKIGGAPTPETPTFGRMCGDIFAVSCTNFDPWACCEGIFFGRSITVGAGAMGTIRGTADAALITAGNSAASSSPALIAGEGSPQAAQ